MSGTLQTGVTSKYARLKKLRDHPAESTDQTVARVNSLLESYPEAGTVRLRLIDKAHQERQYTLKAGGSTEASRSPKPPPLVELIMSPDTFNRLAAAETSPLEAFLKGALRVRGDHAFAQDLIAHLAGTGGATRLCGEAKQWQP